MRVLILLLVCAIASGAMAQPGPPEPPPGGPPHPRGGAPPEVDEDDGPPARGPVDATRGLAKLIEPRRDQWIGFARFTLRAVRTLWGHGATLAALRIELVTLLAAQEWDDKQVDAKVEALTGALAKAGGDVVELVFELSGLLSPEQRRAVAEKIAYRILGGGGPGHGGPGRPPRTRGGRPGGPPPPPPDHHGMSLSPQQRAQLKRLALKTSPPVVRAAGEAAAQLLTPVEELLAESPAKDKVKGAVDAAIAQVSGITKTLVAAAKEARGVLAPGQLDEVLARAPLRILLGGMAGRRFGRPPPR
jgi:hypothetical protein